MFLMVSIMTSKYPQSVLEFDHMMKTWLSFQSPSCQLLIKKKEKESTESHPLLHFTTCTILLAEGKERYLAKDM